MKNIILKDSFSFLRKGNSCLLALGRWFIHYLCTFIFIYLAPLIYKFIAKPNWKDLWFLYRIYAKISLWGFGAKLEIVNHSGIKESDQFIMISNHRSWLDQICLLITMKQQPHFFTKEEYLKTPILGSALTHHKPVPVKNKAIVGKSRELINNYINKGESLLIFPEGTRGLGRKLLPFRFGAFKYASDYKIPLLPLYIFGSEEILSKKRSFFEIKPGKIQIIIGKPIIIGKRFLNREKEAFEKEYIKNYYSYYDNFHSRKKESI